MRLDHLLIVADDMVAMRDFFVDVIGLTDGPRPPFLFPGHWLHSEGIALIHLVERDDAPKRAAYLGATPAPGGGAIDHLALTGGDFAATRDRLEGLGVAHAIRRVPAEGQLQIFVTGPEGVKVELLFPLPIS